MSFGRRQKHLFSNRDDQLVPGSCVGSHQVLKFYLIFTKLVRLGVELLIDKIHN